MALRRQKIQSNNHSRKLVTDAAPKSPVSEQYRTLRTNIEFSQVDDAYRSLMVTSTGPGEGKSTTSANLAVVFAQQGKKVLLIDADLRKPTMHYTFQKMNTVGLSNAVTKQVGLTDAVQSTRVENLDILTSGPIPPNPAELLGSKGMNSLLEEMYRLYDVVIFDTPPVLAVTDAQILANKCDGTVLVVSSGRTEIEAAQKAKEQLQSAQAKLLGVVLNNKEVKSSQYYYYYGGK
ncbi:polysaccharide biosynthesis tyrosine autokinase [Bacillus salacetis]|uniref:non-specific protein-tyrosine kinase n=1 Tax=Bacillus salacetis TaxID=2315464 RepID=A0A3A1R2C4_9BACI|nr:CpsD/CapB family tyrosine-protein kinase [Bacillus salacetis]RIW36063.1 polysaccharide biosynthesis tyrosine autokinase [Bacillus salacetis]